MKCPVCQKEKKFLEFYIKSHPFKTICKSCGTRLKPDRAFKKMMNFEIVLGLIIGTTIYYLQPNTIFEWVLWLIGIAVIVFPIDYYAWKNGCYLEVENMETV
ncbi:MAG: hypothetical protein JEZ08_20855 [Clostridiales bacterium]|nr:hypothetical protein [Clostridiales bacterium]